MEIRKDYMTKAAAQLTHCGRKLHQTQGADFHLELVPSAKYRSKTRKITQISMTKHMT
jgi:2,4-dienoyl-CoA reductase-like NADH-dependent reductase (Old Yellow Enzyme family)